MKVHWLERRARSERAGAGHSCGAAGGAARGPSEDGAARQPRRGLALLLVGLQLMRAAPRLGVTRLLLSQQHYYVQMVNNSATIIATRHATDYNLYTPYQNLTTNQHGKMPITATILRIHKTALTFHANEFKQTSNNKYLACIYFYTKIYQIQQNST